MKLMVASDIHGSAYFCAQMLEALDREQADKLVLLGDILYHGPRNDLPQEYAPKKVLAMLNERKQDILCIRGNCDTEVDQMVLEFPVLSEQGLLYVNGHTIYLKHGHNITGNGRLALKDGDILLCGHTHVPKCEYRSCVDDSVVEEGCDKVPAYLYMNPGSVSIPKEDSWHGYMIVEQDFVWKALDGRIWFTKTV